MARFVYKLGEHTLKVVVKRKNQPKKKVFRTVPILTRALEKTGTLLGLELATDDDLLTIRKIISTADPEEEGEEGSNESEGEEATLEREVIYRKIGSWRADRVILVHEKEEEEEEGEGQEEEQEEEEEEGQKKVKLRRIHIPIPSWAPNYKVFPTLFRKAKAAGLKTVGIYRHGYLFPPSDQIEEEEG